MCVCVEENMDRKTRAESPVKRHVGSSSPGEKAYPPAIKKKVHLMDRGRGF